MSKLINDTPLHEKGNTRNDGLNFSNYGRVLSESIKNTEGPFTIGIYGGWGTGKTSLMKVIEKQIKEENDEIITVWFNAWQYEKDDHLLIPLVGEITTQLQKEKNKFGEAFERVINIFFSLAYALKIKWKGFIPGVEAELAFKDTFDKYLESENDSIAKDSYYFQTFKYFDKFQDEKFQKKFLIIIDDLDRCMPNKAIELLEELKLIFNQQRFIFVLGVAREILVKHLNFKYETELGIEGFNGESYLDKIIQLQFPFLHQTIKLYPISLNLYVKTSMPHLQK
jgi:predicted KAP-like P-loop ATPase